ncbi:MAG: tetratricopeptide repeat protein, partial [Armatimonadota bacterium]
RAGEGPAPGPRPTGEPARGGGEEESEEEARRAQAVRLVNRARDLNRSGNWRQAVDLLRVAAATDPSYSQPHRWLGYIYEQQYDRATKGEQRGEFQRKAIAAYAKALSIKRDAEFVEPHMARLFFARDFPRVLDAESVPYAPARFAIGSALLVPPDAPESEPVRGGYAYTVSVVYPPESKDATGIEVWPRSPRGGMRYGRASAEAQERFNRVSYGFTLQPREGMYTLQFVAHYASEALQLRSVGVEALAARVMGALLHFYWYSVVYLGVQPVDVSDVWLSQYSEAGAAQTGEDILINDIGTPREPIEWLREVAHEYGHLVLPRIGDFVEPDDTGSGVLGERLFLAWLADEAERVAGGKWPASSVQSAANAMWGGEDVAVESFVANHCDEPLVFWLLHGPKSELASGRSREALEWLTGLALYVEAAHGAPMLAQAFRDTEGEGPEDFLRGCQRAVERRLEVGALHVKPAVFIPGASEADTAGYHRLGSSAGVQLPPDGRAAYWVYLPTGSWTCRVRAQSEGDVTLGVALDGAASSGLVIRAGDESGEAALRDVQGGWHRLVISVANAEGEVMLEDIAIGEAG